MRITPEFILKFIHETIDRRVHSGRDLLAVYLCGSFLDQDYLIGGAGDVDLFIIHNDSSEATREIVRLTDNIHLDIAHHNQRIYRNTRRLRVDPWIGPALNACKVIYDPQHFLDFIQASVRGQYDRPDHIYERARSQADQARENWFQLQAQPADQDVRNTQTYLDAICKAANAIASLSGHPLAERRLLLEFMPRAEAVGRSGLYHGLLGLLGTPNLDQTLLNEWIIQWKSAYLSLPKRDDLIRFHPARLNYFLFAFQDLIASERPLNVLWPLINTWTDIVAYLPENSAKLSDWKQTVELLGLSNQGLLEKIKALDAYLDLVEESLETWARANGAWESV